MQGTKIFLLFIAGLIAVLGLGYFLFQSSQPTNQEMPGETIEAINQEHIAQGSTEHEPYNSNPPTSGWHWPEPARCMAYPSPMPDEQLIHNLEHGAIWISYKLAVDQPTKDKLNDFVNRYSNILITPRDQNDSNIALAAWGKLLKLDSYDEGQIISFINAYIDKGPERGITCLR